MKKIYVVESGNGKTKSIDAFVIDQKVKRFLIINGTKLHHKNYIWFDMLIDIL